MALSDSLSAAFELNGTLIDDFGGASLTASGGATFGTGHVYPQAAETVSASSQYFFSNSFAGVEFGDIDYTIEVWVKLTDTPAAATQSSIVSKDSNTPANSRDFTFDVDSTSGYRLYINGGGGAIVVTGAGIIDTNWHQFFLEHDSTADMLRIRFDDISTYQSSSSSLVPNLSSAQLRLGARQFAGFEDYADLIVGPVRFWKRLLNASEKTDLWNSGNGRTYAYLTAVGSDRAAEPFCPPGGINPALGYNFPPVTSFRKFRSESVAPPPIPPGEARVVQPDGFEFLHPGGRNPALGYNFPPLTNVSKFRGPPTLQQAPGTPEIEAQLGQVFQIPYPASSPVQGPWRRSPVFTGSQTDPAPPPPPTQESVVTAPPYPSRSPVPGPWNNFNLGRVPFPGVSTPVAADGTPVQPDPSPIGTARLLAPAIPRAPELSDGRLRAHLDKVQTLLNSLLRRGYITRDPVRDGEYVISGGSIALPRAPLATDDASVGAFVGSCFVNTLTSELYFCVNASVGSAVWRRVQLA